MSRFPRLFVPYFGGGVFFAPTLVVPVRSSGLRGSPAAGCHLRCIVLYTRRRMLVVLHNGLIPAGWTWDRVWAKQLKKTSTQHTSMCIRSRLMDTVLFGELFRSNSGFRSPAATISQIHHSSSLEARRCRLRMRGWEMCGNLGPSARRARLPLLICVRLL